MGPLIALRRAGPLTHIVLLAIGYYLTGRLALFMAIPPGYATAVWPAAGLALAGLLAFGYRAWPGIVLGSLCINFPTSYASAGAVLPAAAMALGLGFGAALQALLGALLLRRRVAQPVVYAEVQQIGRLLLLGGPVACVVSATVGVATLSASGIVPPASIGFHWFTWWVGDTIGVLLVLPAFLIWRAPADVLPRRNKILASLPIIVVLALVTLLFVRTNTLEQQRIAHEFGQRSDRIAHALDLQFARYVEVVHAVAGFHGAMGEQVDRRAFHAAVADLLARHPGLHALSWSPRVSHSQRAAYEQATAREGQVRISQLGPHGALVPAAERADYFPVTYIEPLEGNVAALGFDLASEADRREMLQRSRHSGHPAASGQVDLVQGAPGLSGVLVVAPAYWPTLAHDTPEQRGHALRGYASAVMRIDETMASFLRGIDVQGMQLRLVDTAAAPARRLLHATAVAPADPGRRNSPSDPGRLLTRAVDLEVGGRPWQLVFSLEPDHAIARPSPWAWGVPGAGLLFTGLFSALLLVIVGRTAAVQLRVRERTAALNLANAALRDSLVEHARSETALQASEDQARAIIETARDAYIAADEHSRILDWNREAENTFGWTRTEAVGRLLPELIIPESHRGAHADWLAHFWATGESDTLNQRIEIDALHRDGRSLPIELTAWATKDGGTCRFHAFIHDISQRRRASQRLAAQEAAAAALVQSATLVEAAPKVLHSVCTALGWRVGALWMIDAEAEADTLRCSELWQRDSAPSPTFTAVSRSTRFAPGQGLPGRVWSSGKPLWIPDVTLDGNFPRAICAAQDGLHAAFAFPITSSGEVLGVVEFFSDSIEAPDEGLLTMMDTLGNLLGQFVARTRVEAALFEEKERAEVTLRSIADGVIVIDTQGRVTYLNPVAETMTGWGAAEARGQPVGDVLSVVDHQTGEPGRNPLLLALHDNRPTAISSSSDLVRRDGFHSAIEDSAAPIHDHQGNVLGSVMVFHDISEPRAMALKMAHLAQHDYLTDLPNRVLLQDRFAQAIVRARREHGNLALLYTDLDGFKHINDSLGHEVGDLLLQQVAQRLLHSVRSMDTVSRQGGDEFVILLPEIRSSTDAARVADNVLQAMRTPFHVADTELNVTLSIGISLYPNDGDDPGVLLKYADAAMYQAKQHGRDQHRFYTRAISDRADRRLSIESSLHRALRNNEFVLHYQPKVIPDTGAITGMEALVRWQPPSGALCFPDEFIGIAEESGLIARIDQWVLEEACRQNRAWQDAGLVRVPVAVNLAAAYTNAERYPDDLAAVLTRTGLDPDCLQIEITESQMLRDTERFETLIRGIKAVGAKVAIDDFGTGYSSLGYLCRFPFDVLKIDRTFVQALAVDSKQIAIVETIVRLAHTLDYVVVAEGVETWDQARILQAHGCHEMQGYLYSRPVPAAQFEQLLRGRVIVPPAQPSVA